MFELRESKKKKKLLEAFWECDFCFGQEEDKLKQRSDFLSVNLSENNKISCGIKRKFKRSCQVNMGLTAIYATSDPRSSSLLEQAYMLLALIDVDDVSCEKRTLIVSYLRIFLNF